MSDGCIRTRITAALAFCVVELGALVLGRYDRAVRALLREEGRGLGVDQLAQLDVRGLDRRARDVVDDADAPAPHGVLETVPGSGPRSRSSTMAGSPSTPRAPSRLLRMSVRRPKPGLRRTRSGTAARAISRSSSLEPRRVAVLDDLVVAHQLARPLDGADPDQQEGESEGAAEREVHRAEPEDRRPAGRWRSSTRRTRARAGSPAPNMAATCRSARFSRAGSTSVGRGWCSGRPGSGIGSPTSPPGCSSRVVAVARREVAHWLWLFFFARAPLLLIQTVARTRPPIPTSQPQRPSETGPRPPSFAPP